VKPAVPRQLYEHFPYGLLPHKIESSHFSIMIISKISNAHRLNHEVMARRQPDTAIPQKRVHRKRVYFRKALPHGQNALVSGILFHRSLLSCLQISSNKGLKKLEPLPTLLIAFLFHVFILGRHYLTDRTRWFQEYFSTAHYFLVS
jgi:hypothetical protein